VGRNKLLNSKIVTKTDNSINTIMYFVNIILSIALLLLFYFLIKAGIVLSIYIAVGYFVIATIVFICVWATKKRQKKVFDKFKQQYSEKYVRDEKYGIIRNKVQEKIGEVQKIQQAKEIAEQNRQKALMEAERISQEAERARHELELKDRLLVSGLDIAAEQAAERARLEIEERVRLEREEEMEKFRLAVEEANFIAKQRLENEKFNVLQELQKAKSDAENARRELEELTKVESEKIDKARREAEEMARIAKEEEMKEAKAELLRIKELTENTLKRTLEEAEKAKLDAINETERLKKEMSLCNEMQKKFYQFKIDMAEKKKKEVEKKAQLITLELNTAKKEVEEVKKSTAQQYIDIDKIREEIELAKIKDIEKAQTDAEYQAAREIERIRKEAEKEKAFEIAKVRKEIESSKLTVLEQFEKIKRKLQKSAEQRMLDLDREKSDLERQKNELEKLKDNAIHESEQARLLALEEVDRQLANNNEEKERFKRDLEYRVMISATEEQKNKLLNEKWIAERVSHKRIEIIKLKLDILEIKTKRQSDEILLKINEIEEGFDSDERNSPELRELINNAKLEAKHAGEIAELNEELERRMYKEPIIREKRIVKKVVERVNSVPPKRLVTGTLTNVKKRPQGYDDRYSITSRPKKHSVDKSKATKSRKYRDDYMQDDY